MFKKLSLLISFLIFLSAQTAVAQVEVELDSISVTASRISTSISESGKNVSVITQRDIQQMPVTSVDELLRTLPGVNINSRQGFGVQADVGVRGSTFSQVLFMLDNVPLNDPLTAHFNTNIPVALSEIGQIELVRGPASASYGADAVGGVVHIKTRSYLRRQINAGDELQTSVFADLGGGQHNLLKGDIGIDLNKNRWRFSASMRHISSDGEELSNPVFEPGDSDEPTYDNYFEMTNYSASLSYRLSDYFTVYTRGGFDDRDFSARYFYTRSQFDHSEEQITNRWGLGAVTFEKDAHRSEFNISYRNVDDTFDFWPGTLPPNEHTTDQLFLNLSHQYEFSGEAISNRMNYIRLMAGGQYLDKQIESTDRGSHQTDMGGIYTIGHFSWVNGLNVTASARLQYDSIASTEFLPQLSASYNVGDVTLRGSAGRAIRVGDFTERYISSQIPDLAPGRNIGNPDLQPERSWTVDAGFDWRPASRIKVSPTVFYRSSSNLIDYALTNSNNITNADNLQPNEEYFYAMNIEQSSAAGVEFLTDATENLGNNRSVGMQAGYTYIRTTSDGDEPSKYIANHPKHQVNLGLRFSTRWGSVHTENSYRIRSEESAELVDGDVPSGYFISNLNLQVTPGWSPAMLYIQVMNLTDTQYQEILGAPMPGRWVMGGLKLRF
ncbi:TonB-dependent receptor plug domain-containing protein [Rhodohalobacter sp. 8-1]|uniref:TonB-dependent receptor plug domain-containing protein n=1 Tax=Rhodohalobacter sp. 8-1 TaxID=3131972 RepID=UPI0030ED2498